MERGFEQTTVAEIAERAGLTKRTFFRYFTDKRDVLFPGSGFLQNAMVGAVADAPDASPPMAAVAAGLAAAAGLLRERGPEAWARRAVIAANPELQERELIKLANLAAAIAEALRERGVAERTAKLAAEAGIAAFKIAFEHWDDAPGRQDLSRLITETLHELKAATAGIQAS
jgi:AcrR family transcriptional regulator